MSGPRYVADGNAMPCAVMEGFAVVYHPPSRATHLLAPPAPEILAAIAPERGAADADMVLTRLRDAYDLDGGVEAIAAGLAELAAIGLARTT